MSLPLVGLIASLAAIAVVTLHAGLPWASPQARGESASRRLLETDICSWMWGDAGTGFLGHSAAELDPLRWKTMRCEAIAEDLERYNTTENSRRPVEMEVGSGGGRRVFQSLDEAISYLHQRNEYYKWMWADVDGPLLHKLAEINPLRWSAWMTAAAAIEDLRKYREEDDRPVEVLLGKTGSSKQFKNIDEAIWFLSQREGGSGGSSVVALVFAVAACVLLVAAGALSFYLLRLRRQTAKQDCALFLPVAERESATGDNEERTPADTAINMWWLVGLGALLLGAVFAGVMAAVLWGQAGSHSMGAPSDACLGAADQEVWKHGGSHDFDSVMNECATPCMGKSGCVTKCIQKREKYTDTCAQCMGDLAGCTAANCMFQCMSGASPSCVQCAKSRCKPAFRLCSGLSH